MEKDYKNRIVLVEKFQKIEQNSNLFCRSVNDFYYWHLFRKWIFDEICKEIRGFEFGGHPDYHAQFSIKNITKKSCSILLNIFRSLFCLFRKEVPEIDVLFLGNWKKTVEDGQVKNIFLDDLISKIEDANIKYCIFERPNQMKHVEDKHEKKTYLTDYLEFCWAISIAKKKWSKEYKSVFEDITLTVSELEKIFGIKIDRKKLFKRVKYVTSGYYELTKLLVKVFKKWRPDCVVEIESYSVFSLICNGVLKELNIPIIELQHGQIGSGHIAYNLSGIGCERYLPTCIACFGQYWIDDCSLPGKGRLMVPTGSIPMENNLRYFTQESKKSNRILIILQGNDGGSLDKFVEELLQLGATHNYEIVVKLHPSESSSWRKIHPKIASLEKQVTVVSGGDIGRYLNDSLAVVGISSTVLFEAIAFEKKVFVLNTIDSEIVNALVEKGIARSVESGKQLLEYLDTDNCNNHWCNSAKSYVWQNHASQNITNLIKRTITLQSSKENLTGNEK